MLIEAIVIGSTFYAGNKVYQKFDRQQVSSQFKSQVKGWFTRSNTKHFSKNGIRLSLSLKESTRQEGGSTHFW